LNGKDCDPQEFLRREDHDRNCPAMQEWWRQHFAEFMSDSKDDRRKLWQRTDEHRDLINQSELNTQKLINENIRKAQSWLISFLVIMLGGFVGIVVTRYYSDVQIMDEIRKIQTTQSQIGWQSGKVIGNGD
jgi:hypothetical protein